MKKLSPQHAMWSATAGLLLIMVGTLLPLLRLPVGIWGYIYAIGAAVLFVARLLTPALEDADLRLRRLVRLETWSALLFCVGAFFIFYAHVDGMDWLAFTLAGGLVQAYTSIMIPKASKASKASKK